MDDRSHPNKKKTMITLLYSTFIDPIHGRNHYENTYTKKFCQTLAHKQFYTNANRTLLSFLQVERKESRISVIRQISVSETKSTFKFD